MVSLALCFGSVNGTFSRESWDNGGQITVFLNEDLYMPKWPCITLPWALVTAQGFYFSPPLVPLNEFERLFEKGDPVEGRVRQESIGVR